MAVTTVTSADTFVKNIAKAAFENAPYLTEGATEITADEVVGKSVGEEYTFKVDDVDVVYSDSGMYDDSSLSDQSSSRTAKIKIANALAYINNGALDRKLAFGNWEDFCKTAGAKVARELTTKTALADIGKGEEAVACSDVNDMVAKMYEMTQWGVCRGYGSFAGVGKVLSTSKNNAPVYMKGEYAEAQKGIAFANLDILRGIQLPTIDCSASASSGLSALGVTTAGVFSCTGTPTAGTAVQIGTKKLWAYFPDTTASHAIVIGDKSQYATAITGASVGADTNKYEAIIVRADGAQGYLDASALVESAKESQSNGGIGIAHSERDNSKGGKIHRFDAVGAFGIADLKRAKVMLLKV